MSKAHVSNPEHVSPLYGLAIMNLKLGFYQDSLDFTIQATSMEIHDSIMKINLLYLAALINKKLKKYEDATYAYSQLIKIIIRYENRILTKYTWGMLLIPLIKDRRKIISMLENLWSMMNYLTVREPKDVISTTYSYATDKWISAEAAEQYIHTRKFFKRYL